MFGLLIKAFTALNKMYYFGLIIAKSLLLLNIDLPNQCIIIRCFITPNSNYI